MKLIPTTWKSLIFQSQYQLHNECEITHSPMGVLTGNNTPEMNMKQFFSYRFLFKVMNGMQSSYLVKVEAAFGGRSSPSTQPRMGLMWRTLASSYSGLILRSFQIYCTRIGVWGFEYAKGFRHSIFSIDSSMNHLPYGRLDVVRNFSNMQRMFINEFTMIYCLGMAESRRKQNTQQSFWKFFIVYQVNVIL